MLNDILEFFKKEKFYTVLFLLAVVGMSYAVLRKESEKEKSENAATVERFHQMEKKLETKVKDAGSLEAYFKQHPVTTQVFGFFSLAIIGVFGLGLVLDFGLMWKPAWRARLVRPRPPDAVGWKISMLVKVLLLFLTSGIVLGFLLGLAKRIFAWPLSDNFYLLFHTTLMDFLCFVFILRILKKGNGGWQDLGLNIPGGKIFREVLLGWAGYAALLPLFLGTLAALVAFANWVHYEPPPHPLVGIFLEEERSPFLVAYSIVLGTVLGPVLEEIFFRGFCYPILKKRFGMFLAMVLTSIFFASIHGNSFAFLPIFILGMGLALLYEIRGSLVAPIALHITHNMIFIGYFFLAKTFLVHASGG